MDKINQGFTTPAYNKENVGPKTITDQKVHGVSSMMVVDATDCSESASKRVCLPVVKKGFVNPKTGKHEQLMTRIEPIVWPSLFPGGPPPSEEQQKDMYNMARLAIDNKSAKIETVVRARWFKVVKINHSL